jgi:putative ABC transport system substrate-binding protein
MRRAKPLILATTLMLPLTAQSQASATDLTKLLDEVSSLADDSTPTALHRLENRLYTLAANTLEPASTADAGRIAVIYPDLGEPYHSVFQQILSGIEQTAPTRVVGIALPESLHPDQLERRLRDEGAAVVIALGRHGLKAASELPKTLPVVGGAVLAAPDDGPGASTLVSLTPDPQLLLKHLKRMAPSVRRVFTVYSARQNDWLMALAQKAASAQGIELVQLETDDLRIALQRFHEIVDTAEPGHDAIWLPQDTAVLDDQVVLPFVLQQAWDRSLIVFSSTLAHVRRGALFALYPDNVDMGRQLANSALSLIETTHPRRTVQPLREVRLALNTRTAGHLGLNLEAVQKDVVLLFPVR